jgi:hypothetical protein
MFRSIIASGLVAVLIIFGASPTLAGSGAGAVVLQVNTSVRAEGFGGAGVALPWGSNTPHWANPALLAYRAGIDYIDFRSELAVGLTDDIVITNQELILGAYGVGVLIGKGPVDGLYLDMGEHNATDEEGNPTGTFNSYMKSESWGLGLDLVRVAEAITGRPEGSWTRYASLSGGWVWKDFMDQLAPDNIIQDASGGGSASGSASDRGFMIAATPLNLGHAGDSLADEAVGVVLGASFGMSVLNKTDEMITHVDADQSDPFPTMYLTGWSLRLAVPWADAQRDRMNASGWGMLGDMLNPFFSLTYSSQKNEPGYVWDNDLEDYIYEHDTSGRYDENGHGWEVGFANLVYLRKGRVEVAYGDIDGETTGWGINLQAGRYGGFRYDAATVPQARGLPNVDRRSWSLWVDPVAIFVKN